MYEIDDDPYPYFDTQNIFKRITVLIITETSILNCNGIMYNKDKEQVRKRQKKM